jgi:hypothetical protein
LVSASDDPTQGWYMYNIATGNNTVGCPDFPRVGQDKQAIYLASNIFSNCSSYAYEEWVFLGKAQMESGSGFSGYYTYNLHNPDGTATFSSQPANVFDPYDNPRAEFFTNSNWYGGNNLNVWAVSNPLYASTSPGPELTAYSVATTNTYSVPPNANQPGGNGTIDTGDARISGEVTYNAGSLYAALASGTGNGTPAVIAYKINPSLNDGNNARCTGSYQYLCADITYATIINEVCFGCGGFGDTTTGVFYPTVQPDPEGNWTMVYNLSGGSIYATTGFLSNRVTKKPGTIRDTGYYFAPGNHFYSQGRWGDYTAVAPAGLGSNSNGTMWIAGMMTLSDGTWGTIISRNGFSAINQP